MRFTKRRIVLAVLLALAGVVVLLNWTWGRLPDAPPMSGRIERVGGLRVRVIEHAGRGPAVVFVHGLPGTGQDFDHVAPLLRGRHTIAYDRPGYGFSEGGFHRFEQQLTTLHALIARLHGERVVLVGHSYGGALALAYAERHPEDLRGLVLIDAAAGGHKSAFADKLQAHFVHVINTPVIRQIGDATFVPLALKLSAKGGDSRAFHPGEVDDEHLQRLLGLNMKHDDLDAFAGEVLEGSGAIAALDRRVGDIQTPTVVIQGKDDVLVKPERARRTAAALPHARLVMVSGGHMAPYVHPAVVAAAVRELSSGARPGARPPDRRR